MYAKRHVLLAALLGAVVAHGVALWCGLHGGRAAQAADTRLGRQEAPRRHAATLVRVIDGDTLVCNVALGFRLIRVNEHVRLAGIDAPERNTTGGVKAKTHLEELLSAADLDPDEDGVQLTLVVDATDEADHFGRTLARVEGRNGKDVGRQMLADGYAEEHEHGKAAAKTAAE